MILVLTFAIATDTFFLRRAVPNVSAVESAGSIGIYWDKNCSQRVSSIDWGVLSQGQVKDAIIYVRNEGNESTILVETATNWSPTGASRYLIFSWRCQNEKLRAGTVVKVTQELSVSPNIQGISQFSFNITVEGRKYFQGDVNKDGMVDMLDISMVVDAFGSSSGSPNWNPAADFNNDGTVDQLDIAIVVRDFGKSNT